MPAKSRAALPVYPLSTDIVPSVSAISKSSGVSAAGTGVPAAAGVRASWAPM